MPIYEYRCDNCGHELEAFQKLGEALLVECPQCEQNALRKRISAAGFRLKGGGWYETDFKSGKKKNVSAGDGDSGSSDKSSGESASSSSDSKSSSNTDSKSSSAASKPASE